MLGARPDGRRHRLRHAERRHPRAPEGQGRRRASAAASSTCADILDERVKRQQLDRRARARPDARAPLAAPPTTRASSSADLVIEAVFEDLALKHARPPRGRGARARTRASSRPTPRRSRSRKIAEASTHPEHVVGMHYFSPVHKMPLLEVIRTEHDRAVGGGDRGGARQEAGQDGHRRQRRRRLLHDAASSRRIMNEAAYLLAEGVADRGDRRALVDWGFPVGPITLLDEVGIDVAAHVGDSCTRRSASACAAARGDREARRRRSQGPQERARLLPLRRRRAKRRASASTTASTRAARRRSRRATRPDARGDPDALRARSS